DLVGFHDDYGISDCGVLRCEAYGGFALRRCFDIEVAESLPKRREEFGDEVHHTNFTPCTSSRAPLLAPANTLSWSLYFSSPPQRQGVRRRRGGEHAVAVLLERLGDDRAQQRLVPHQQNRLASFLDHFRLRGRPLALRGVAQARQENLERRPLIHLAVQPHLS